MHPFLIAAALAASVAPAAETDCPHEPGCPALTVSHEIELDNTHGHPFLSARIVRRFFTQEGIERFADFRLEEDPYIWDLSDVRGKVTLPDGSTRTFGAEDASRSKMLRLQDGRLQVSSITPPGLVPGSTVEFSYRREARKSGTLSTFEWRLQEPIPVLSAVCTLRQGSLELQWQQSGQEPVQIAQDGHQKGVVVFRAERIPSIPMEPYSAPPETLAARMSFYSVFQADWLAQLAGQLAGRAGKLMENSVKARSKALELTATAADPQQKAAAIYQFIQEKVEHRASSESRRAAADEAGADEILERGFGDEWERTVLFLAMAREAGLEQGLLAISTRFRGGLHPRSPDEGQFDTFAAAIKTGDKWIFYDPGERLCPPAMVAPQKESLVPNAILVTPKKGEGFTRTGRSAGFIATVYDTAPYNIATIPPSAAERNTTTRQVSLKIGEGGAVDVEVVQTATGLAEMDLRLKYADLDEPAQRKELQQELLYSNALAQLGTAQFEGMGSLASPARVSYTATMPAVVSRLGEQMVIEASIFDTARAPLFGAATRRSAVQLPHTEKSVLRIAIEVPRGFEARDLPERQLIEDGDLKLATFYGRDLDRIVLTRTLIINNVMWDRDAYPKLRSFFERVRQADQQPLILWAQGAER